MSTCSEPILYAGEALRLPPASRAAPRSRRPSTRQVFREVVQAAYKAHRQATDSPSVVQSNGDLTPFKHLEVRPDGGLHFLRTEFKIPWHKYLTVAIGFGVLIFNIFTLLRDARLAYLQTEADGVWHESAEVAKEAMHLRGWMVISRVRRWVLWNTEMAKEVGRNDFHNLQIGFLPKALRQVVVSTFEVAGLLYYVLWTLASIWRTRRPMRKEEDYYRRWEAAAEIHWEIIPSLRTFSAMRALKHVHPQLLPMEVSDIRNRYKALSLSRRRRWFWLTVFLLKRAVVLWFGIQAFTHKFSSTAARLQACDGAPLMQLVYCLVFMNQMIGGVVQMDVQFRRRLMLFLFGGQDAKIDLSEEAVMYVWNSHAAEALRHRAFRCSVPELASDSGKASSDVVILSDIAKKEEAALTTRDWIGCWIRWTVYMGGFSHIDLQQCMLKEQEEMKQQRCEMLKRWGLEDDQLDRCRTWSLATG